MSDLFALSNQRIAVLCRSVQEVRIVDAGTGQQLPSKLPINGHNAVLGPDGRHLLVVSGYGQIQEVDLDQMVITRSATLTHGLQCVYCVPNQLLHVSADGGHLMVIAAPGAPELRSDVNATVTWIVETNTLARIAEVPVGPYTRDAFETPDGRALVIARVVFGPTAAPPDRSALRLVEVPSGREHEQWPGGVNMIEVVSTPARD